MYYYFSCDYPAALKLNGIYMGIITDTVKYCKADPAAPPLAEILPLGAEGAAPLAFLPDDNFLNSPPDNMSVTDLKGGYFFRLKRRCAAGGFSVIAQEKYPDLLVTVFNENGAKLSIETRADFFAESLEFPIISASFERFNLKGEEFLAVSASAAEEEGTLLFIYRTGQKTEKLLATDVQSFETETGLTTVRHIKDMAKHTVTSAWDFDGTKLYEKEKTVAANPGFSPEKLPEKLLPYAFAEEFLCGGDISGYLGEDILKNADKLGGYLSGFIGVMPPPRFRKEDEVGLIYPRGKNVYEVKYAVFTLSSRKIVNLRIQDN